MSTVVDNLVVLRFHGIFYTDFICQGHQKGVAKGILGVCITIIVRERMVWDEVFLKLRVSFMEW